MKTLISILCLTLVLAGCMPTVSQRMVQADRLAASAGMEPFTFESELPLSGYRQIRQPGEPLWVFIEGDGLAWVSATQPSRNPTPLSPVALELAAADPAANRVYLARPGQYSQKPVAQKYWLDARFAPEVVETLAQAVDAELARAETERLYLVGFSGGGALAILLACNLLEHNDVPPQAVITVAGNLDIRRWAELKEVSPLHASLNPADCAAQLNQMPQRHLIGGADQAVPAAVLDSYLHQAGTDRCIERLGVDDADHQGPWTPVWLESRASLPRCEQARGED